MEEGCWNPQVEMMPINELARVQEKRLRAIVQHVYRNFRLYRNKMKESNVKPVDVTRVSDLVKMPFTTKSDLAKVYPYGYLSQRVKAHAVLLTSGTTGKPTSILLSKRDSELAIEMCCRGFYSLGVRETDVVQVILPTVLEWLYQSAFMKLGALSIPIGVGNTERQIMILNDFRTTVIVATPSYLLYMADVAEAAGFDSRSTDLRIAALAGERLAPSLRDKLEEKWGITAYSFYGGMELGTAFFNCREREGHHAHADHVIVEVVDPNTGEVMEDGEEGELVFTTLTRRAMPLIRYRTRDITSLIRDKCNCGRTHPRIGPIMGRVDDMVKIKGSSVFPSQVEDAIMGMPEIENYQVVVTKRGNLDALILKVVAKRYSEDLIQRIKNRVKASTNVTPEIEFIKPELLRQEWKTKHFVDLRVEN
jgi:phenylacetate-CoA ligase